VTEPSAVDVLASDDEREAIVETLRYHHGTGRLTLAELDERVGAAYAARTRDQLAALLTDLPTDEYEHEGTTTRHFDPCLFWVLIIAFPPAGLAYWIYTRR
jgi:hypothetical protein